MQLTDFTINTLLHLKVQSKSKAAKFVMTSGLVRGGGPEDSRCCATLPLSNERTVTIRKYCRFPDEVFVNVGSAICTITSKAAGLTDSIHSCS